MLSAVLREHPDVLSLSEFFGTLRTALSGAPFPEGELDGRELWQLLGRPFPMLDEMISSGLRIAELGYPLGRGRFTLAAGVPLICHYVLPMLTSDPDALYDTLAGQVPRWPRRPAAAQCEAFFGYLAGLLGRPVVVERSAASLNLVGRPRSRAARGHRRSAAAGGAVRALRGRDLPALRCREADVLSRPGGGLRPVSVVPDDLRRSRGAQPAADRSLASPALRGPAR
jgi:hypothetical protein